MYAGEFLKSAAKELASLDPGVQRRVARRIDRLAEDPHAGAVKLRGTDDVWRVRVGDYRVLYRVEGVGRLVVLVIKIAHRGDVYR